MTEAKRDDLAEDFRLLASYRRTARDYRRRYEASAEQTKALKADWQAAEARLSTFLDELVSPPPLFAGKAEAVDVNVEVLAGVREAEAARADADSPGWPSAAADAWRLAPVVELYLAERTEELLAEQDVRTVGELVALTAAPGAMWLDVTEVNDVADCLDRFRGRLGNDQIADLDAARAGGPAPEPEPAPKRRRKARTA